MRTINFYVYIFISVFALPSVVSAHSGHGKNSDPFSLFHYLIDHAYISIGIAFFLALAIMNYKLKQKK